MRSLFVFCLSMSVATLAASDLNDLKAHISPCAQELIVAAKQGGLRNIRDEARIRCRNGSDKSCPDLWLVYAFAELTLKGPDALAVAKKATRRLPNSAIAHYYYALALGSEIGSRGVIYAYSRTGDVRKAFEKVLQLDPECHEARRLLVRLYAAPGFLGGDPERLKLHLTELDRRDPYYAALAYGNVAYLNKDYATAASFFHEAQRLRPEKSKPAKELLKLNISAGNFEEAFAACLNLKTESSDPGSNDEMFVELSARSGLRSEEALNASARFLSSPEMASPLERADVLIHTAIILKRLGRGAEALKRVSEAEQLWSGAERAFREREKSYQKQMNPVASR